MAGDHVVEYSKLESSMSNDLSSFVNVFGGWVLRPEVRFMPTAPCLV